MTDRDHIAITIHAHVFRPPQRRALHAACACGERFISCSIGDVAIDDLEWQWAQHLAEKLSEVSRIV